MTSPSNRAPTKGLVVAAPNSSSGKTTFCLGLAAALKDRGMNVEVAKCGPGYIDPQFLSAAIEQPCFNLDKWAMGTDQLRARAGTIAHGSDIVLLEGMMGLFDGAKGMDGSTADIAAALDLPVLLLIDASGHSQSIAATVYGFVAMAKNVKICGVVANRVGSARHADLLREALDEINIPMFGAVLRSESLTIPSRHLGLVQAEEVDAQTRLVDVAKRRVSLDVDLDALLAGAGMFEAAGAVTPIPPLGQRIAVAQDIAFRFAYPHLLTDWRQCGAEIEYFSPLADEAPSASCDAVYLPGGYPELHAGTLARAGQFRQGLRDAAARGVRIYGECGGYMVLGRSLIDKNGVPHRMAGLLDHVTSFEHRKLHLGYRVLTPQAVPDWPRSFRGHEFHYSTLDARGADAPLFQVADARGSALGFAGGRRGSVMGSYMHIIDHAPSGTAA
ncbi:MAG: cobyrinate a,c-diamide synthase [Pseudomonadota bacterium]